MEDKGRFFSDDRYERMIAEGDERIVSLGWYHSYRDSNRRVSKAFGAFDKSVLDLKRRKCSAVRLFAKTVASILEDDVAVCVVPGHNASDANVSGIADVARLVCRQGKSDAVDALIRLKTVGKLSDGGKRERKVHYDSVVYNNGIDLSGRRVVLLDDVTTTGNSLYACRNTILKKSGASRCVMLAVAQTDWRQYWRGRAFMAAERRFKGALLIESADEVKLEKPYKIFLEEKKRLCMENGPMKSEYYEGKYKRFFDPEEDEYDDWIFGHYGMENLKKRDKYQYWHLLLNGELENYMADLQECCEELMDSYLKMFMNVFPAPDPEAGGEWLLYMDWMYEYAATSVLRDVIVCPDGGAGNVEADIKELEEIKRSHIWAF